MTENEFRKTMKKLGWEDEYIENKISKRNDFIKRFGVEPPPLDIYVGNPPVISRYPCFSKEDIKE